MDTTFYKEIGKVKNSEDLVLGNLRLVVHLAKKYQGMGLTLEDLIHEGTIGLCQARDKYDESKGKFSSYAALWIKATIRQALDNTSRTIRVPAHLTHLSDIHPKVSVLDATYQGVENAKVDKIAEDDYMDFKMKALLGKLKPAHAEIIKMKFGIGYDEEMKTTDIAKMLGLTVQAVNFNIRQALNTMKV
jgi:RNA polymerase sigma factor (sigma-70 family)